jgi:DNA-directed RNA polymerase specialized sigma24 family protein
MKLAQVSQPLGGFAEQYPEQTGTMKGYLKKHGVPEREVEDMVSEAWARGLETFDRRHGLQLVQWVWYILQHNILPQYGRRSKAIQEPIEDDPPDHTAASLDEIEAEEQRQRLISFLQRNLPPDLLKLFNIIQEVTAETDSQQFYAEVATRLGIPMPKCRNMVKRLKRTCKLLRDKFSTAI